MRSIVRGYIFLLGLSLASLSANGQTFWAENLPICDYPTNYNLVWTDEFQGSGIDPGNWKTFASFCPDGTQWCQESRLSSPVIWRDENITTSNGLATIKLQNYPAMGLPYTTNTWYGQAMPMTSGLLHGHHAYNCGRFEIRCRLPSLPNSFPAFWLFGEGGNEIDVFEFCGGDYDDMRCSIHRTAPQDPPLHDTYPVTISGDTGFHTYAVEWVADWVIWYFDGSEVHRQARYADLNSDDCTLNGPCTRQNFPADGCEMKVLVSMGHTTSLCGDFTTDFEGFFDVDYVRVYQIPGMFEPGHSDVCAQPVQIVSLTDNRNSFCSVGDILHFKIEGMHGDPILWSITGSGSAALEIIDSNNDECWVRCNGLPGSGYEPVIEAHDPENPCQPGRVFSKSLFLGRPFISSGAGNQNNNFTCPLDDQQHQYWCIDPEVRGAQGIWPYPMHSFTTYYWPLDVYNEYDYGWLQDPSIPEPIPTISSYGFSGYRPYKVFVDGREQTRIFRPTLEWEYAQEGTYEIGYECDYPPLGCQDHWTPWAHGLGYIGDGPFCLWKDGDFCHDVVIEASNGCGTTTESFIVADRCVLGPCNYLDPDFPELLNQYVSIYPTPVVASDFTVVLDDRLDLSQIHRIVVKDAMLVEKAAVLNPSSRESVISTANWPAGVYYVYVYLDSGMQTLKIQLK